MGGIFEGRVALVTGASSGIGRALAHELAGRGCKVGLVARRSEKLDEVAEAIREKGGVAAGEVGDVGDRESLGRAVEGIVQKLGPVEILVANAGVGVPTTLDPINVKDVEETFRVNVLGVVYAIDAVLAGMLARGAGRIAAVSSVAGYRGLPGESAYCASKAALNVYMDGLRVQARGRGVRFTTVCPGFVTTPMTAVNEFTMPFVMSAEEAAKRIARAIGRGAKVHDFPWQTAALIRLSRLAPDWLMARLFREYLEHPPMPPARGD